MGLILTLFLGVTAIQDMPKKNRLEEAVDRGLKAGGDLDEEISKLGKSPLRTKEDALALVRALAKLPVPKEKSEHRTGSLRSLATVYTTIDKADEKAVAVLMDQGMAELRRLYDAFAVAESEKEASDLLFVLQIIAAAPDGVERIVKAANKPFLQESYVWVSIFSQLAQTPLLDPVFDRFRNSLPSGFAGIALLDAANEAALKGDLKKHIFDSAGGKTWLEKCLKHEGEQASYARSAAMALAFVSNPERDRLLAAAAGHSDGKVRVQAAWAQAKVGKEEGVRKLAEFCKDLSLSEVARERLDNLGRKNAIPKEVLEPEFAAKSEFVEWLSHPSELGRVPDTVEVVERRELKWPGKASRETYWLLRYSAKREDGSEDAGIGIAGPETWCSFWREYLSMSPSDVFGRYAARALEQAKLLEDLNMPTDAEMTALIRRWRGPRLEGVRIREVNRLRRNAGDTGELVGIADATQGGKVGWAVFDGELSAFYEKKEFPKDFWHGHVLSAHLGRQALGLPNPTDRATWANRPGPKPATPEAILRSFEREFEAAKKEGTLTELIPSVSPFVTVRLHNYAQTLGALGRGAELKPVLDLLEVEWKGKWAGPYHLGIAAYEAGLKDIALPKLDKAFKEGGGPGRGEDASILAELMVHAGRPGEAKKALLVALRAALAETKEAKYLSDRFLHNGWFQGFRATYLKLFPETGAADLAREGIPEDLLPPTIVVPEK